MKRIALLLSLLFYFFGCSLTYSLGPLSAQKSSLEITWFGTTCFNISDGKTSIFFDPFFNRPGIWDMISFQDYKGDQEVVDKWLSKINTDQMKAIFVSHTHYDHVLDLVATAKATKATVYGSSSAQKIMEGSKLSASRVKVIEDYQELKIGDFKVTVLPGVHAPHVFGLTMSPGPIKKPLAPSSPIYKYKMGKLYNFAIEHPLGNILFHPSGQTTLKKKDFKKHQSDLVIQGIYFRKSTADIIENIIRPAGASQLIPTHYDNLLNPISEGVKPMIFSKFFEFKESLAKLKNIKAHYLEYGKKFYYSPKK